MGTMNRFLFSLLMAALAYSLISVGIVLQKKGIAWIGWKGKKNAAWAMHFSVWVTGFLLMNIYGIPSAVALKTLSPHQVAAFAGWGVVVLVLLSGIFLKETVFRSDFFYSLLIIAGILLLNMTGYRNGGGEIRFNAVTLFFFVIPLLLFLPVLFVKMKDKYMNITGGIVSGCTAGLMVISLKGLVGAHGYRISEYPGSLYLYLYIVFALTSFVSLQISLKNGPALVTGQLQYTFTIIYPAMGAILLFPGLPGMVQLAAIFFIVAGVIRLLKNR